MSLNDVLTQINTFILANGANAITADVLRPILIGMVQQPNDLTGELGNLSTADSTNLVAAINEINSALGDVSGITIHTGADTPLISPPVSFTTGDFYVQEVASVVLSFWQFTGAEWVNVKNVIDDAATSLESTWSSTKIQEAINEKDGFITLGNIVYTNNDATIPAGAQWRISGVVYTNPAPVVVTINAASASNYRTDILVGNTSNTFQIIQGIEGTGTVVAPQLPANTVLASEINIFGASVVSTGPGGGFVNVVGYFDYNDLATQTTPISLSAGVPSKLTNDTQGPFTTLVNAPYGVPTIFDPSTNSFNFSALTLGDTLDIRLDIDVTTTSPAQNVKVYLRLAEGSPSQYDINFIDRDYKSTGPHKITDFSGIYLEYADIRDFPASFYIETDSGGTVKVNGWYCRVIRKGVNIYTLEVSDEAYVQKDFSQGYAYPDTGSGVVLPLRPEGYSNIVLTGSGLVSVEGFNLSLITGVPGAQTPYSGKTLRIYNSTGAAVNLVHNGVGAIPFFFRSGADISIPTGEYLYLDYDISGVADTIKSWQSSDASKLNKDFSALTAATTPLAGTEVVPIIQGGVTKKVAVSNLVGSSARKQTYTLTRDWVTTTLDRVYYINYANNALEFKPGASLHTISETLVGRNAGMFIAPYNCKITKVTLATRNTGSYTGFLGLGSGKMLPSLILDMTNKIIHLDQVITSPGFETRQFDFPIVGGTTITAGDSVCPCMLFSAHFTPTKSGTTIQIEIEEVI
jgi:hypothetical protein